MLGSNIFLVPFQMISCSILNQHLERVNLTQQYSPKNKLLLNNTAGTNVLLQSILKVAARCKMHGINKIFLSSVLNLFKISGDSIKKLNLDISNISKSNRFHFIDNSNISMNFLYKDGLHLLYSGKELLAKKKNLS